LTTPENRLPPPDSPELTGDVRFIQVRSERQAMDWSLVLTSQDISSTLLHRPDEGRWLVAVAPGDYARACEAIRLYQRENRTWEWRQPLPWTGVHFHWGVLFWCVVLLGLHSFDATHGYSLRSRGILDTQAIRAGEWWRLVTAVSLHANIAHLVSNLTMGGLFLGLAMARFGPGWALLTALLSGVIGNVLGWLVYPEPHQGLGASGMVMGGLGLVAVQSVAAWGRHPRALRFLATGVLSGTFLFILLGLDPNTDVIAHAGGYAGGLMFGILLARLPQPSTENPAVNVLCELILTLLVIIAWGLALR
jgi:rhomboid protease GluP